MKATFGGKPIYDLVSATEFIVQNGLPIPDDFRKANAFLHPLGPAAGRGWFLMIRKDIEALDINKQYDLLLYNDGTTTTVGTQYYQNTLTLLTPSVKLSSLVIVKARAVIPSAASDQQLGNSLYLVEVADSRWLCANPLFCQSINKQYNVRAPASGGTYYTGSMNGSSAWTWQTMISDIWGTMSSQIGSAPTLPFTPNGTPENWIFPGVSAYDALTQVLTRIGCAMKPAQGFKIVQVGADDADSDTLLLNQIDKIIHDESFIEGVLGKEPYGVRVFFHMVYSDYGTEQTTPADSSQWMTDSVYYIDVVGPDSTKAASGVYHPIWDDMPALANVDGSVTNVSDLDTRATERANDYYRMLKSYDGRLSRKYATLINVLPSSNINGVAWRQDANGGWITEVVRHPYLHVRADDDGCWCVDSSVGAQPPDFKPTVPNYPVHYQKIQLNSGTPSGGYYDANVLQFDPTSSTWNAKEQCWGFEQNGIATLASGIICDARLSGYASGRPVYTFNGNVSGAPIVIPSGGSITFQGGSTLDLQLDSQWTVAGIWNQTAQTASLTADTFSWIAPNATWIFISATSTWTLYSIKAPSPATGRVIELWNTGSYTIKMPHEDAGSTAADRLHWLDGKTRYLDPGAGVALKYNTDASRWYVLWGCCPGPGGRYRKDVSTQTLAGGTSNNVAIPAASSWYAQPSASATITGMTEDDGTAPQDGRRLFLKNDTALGSGITITLPHADSGSSTANQYSSQTLSQTVLYPQQGIWLEYKASNNGGGGGWTSEDPYGYSRYGQSLDTSSPPTGYLVPPIDLQTVPPTDSQPGGSQRYMPTPNQLWMQMQYPTGTDWQPYSPDPKLYQNQLVLGYQKPNYGGSPTTGHVYVPQQTPVVDLSNGGASWSLDEATGSNKVDSMSGIQLSGNGGSDTITSVTGKKGQCCQWLTSGSTSTLALLSTVAVPALLPGSAGMMVTFWFQPVAGGSPSVHSGGGWTLFDASAGTQWSVLVDAYSGTASFSCFGGGGVPGLTTVTASYTFQVGSWYCILGWLDVTGQILGISVNGTETTSALGGSWAPQSNGGTSFKLGTQWPPSGFLPLGPNYCLMDELTIVMSAPPSSARSGLYSGGNGLFFPMANPVDPSTVPQGDKLQLDAYFGSL